MTARTSGFAASSDASRSEGVFEGVAALFVHNADPNRLGVSKCHAALGCLLGRPQWCRRIDDVRSCDGIAVHFLDMIRGHRPLLVVQLKRLMVGLLVPQHLPNVAPVDALTAYWAFVKMVVAVAGPLRFAGERWRSEICNSCHDRPNTAAP